MPDGAGREDDEGVGAATRMSDDGDEVRREEAVAVAV